MKSILLLGLMFAFVSTGISAQNLLTTFDGFYIKTLGWYDAGSFKPGKNARLPLEISNTFITFGGEAGVYKGAFSMGLSLAYGTEFDESEDEPFPGALDHTSYWRLAGTVRQRLVGTKIKSSLRFHLGAEGGGGFLLYKADEGTEETRFNPITRRDEHLSRERTIPAVYSEASLYVELGFRTVSKKSIIVTFHPMGITGGTASWGFHVAKTGLIIQF